MDIYRLLSTIVSLKHCDSNIRSKFLQMMLSNYEIISVEPLKITGKYSLYEQHEDRNINEDILLKDTSVFIYDEIGNSGYWMIQEVKSIKQAKRVILHPGGYLNGFCSAMIVVKGDRARRFKVFEELGDGIKSYVTKIEDCINISNLKIEWV